MARPPPRTGGSARARRLLADEEAPPRDRLARDRGGQAGGDPAEAERHARAALDIAQALGDPDVECMALAQIGRAVVSAGRVEEGMGLLDEAMAVALGGETSDPLACGDACCTTLVVCDQLADLRRASEWCAAVVEFTERRHFTPVQSWCRSIYGAVLVRAGDWERAETVLTEALRLHQDRRRAGGRALPLSVLAELRLRQGRDEEAARLLEGIEHEPAALAAARGAAHAARRGGDGARPAGRLGSRRAGRGQAARAARRRGARRRASSRRRRRSGRGWRSSPRASRARTSRGRPRCCAAERAAAAPGGRRRRRCSRRRSAVFTRLGFPLEEGRARLALARARAAEGSPLAAPAARDACDRFERLGARRDADEAAALLRELGGSGRTAVRGERDELTAREREVLRWWPRASRTARSRSGS